MTLPPAYRRLLASLPPPAEPTDEEIWLAGMARRVEADARPLFTAVWLWLLQQALDVDEGEAP